MRSCAAFGSLAVFIIAVVGFPGGIEGSKGSPKKKIVCYLGSWANYRHGDGKFVIEDIDPFLCTHAIYGFAKLQDNEIAVFDPYLDLKENWGLGAYDRFNSLRDKNPDLKTLIAIGGWNEGSTKYSQMAASPSSRRTFVASCVQFLRQHKFDGLDLDWEYPAKRGGKPEDKSNFVLLLKELKDAFEPYGFLLTAAVSAGKSTIDAAYDIPEVSKYLDFINVMSYDFHGAWDKVTGHNAPLYARPDDEDKELNVDSAVNHWLSKGAAREKLVLGMPLYGRGFSLQDPKNKGLGAPVTGPGRAGQFTNQPGMMGYNEICEILNNDKAYQVTFESHVEAPYATKGKEWIGYDDERSISLKAKYIQKHNLGGGMVWSLETDDFRGKCHGKRYPLLRTIYRVLNGREPPSVPEVSSEGPDIVQSSSLRPVVVSTSTESKIPTAPTEIDILPCPYSGYFRHPKDCKVFFFCQKSGDLGRNVYYMFRCSRGTVFSQDIRVCTYPETVPGCH